MAVMLADVARASLAAAPHPGVRVTRLEVTLPVELELGHAGELAGDLPRFIRRTAFDAPPSRLTVVWEETAS
jgi:hypothetical protein